MLSSWKTRFQSLIVETDREAPQGQAENSEVSHLQRVLADLRRSEDGPRGAANEPRLVKPKVIEAAAEPKGPGAPAEPAASAPPAAVAAVEENDAAPTDETFERACQFIDEHRETVQSLLHELGALEECAKSRARITDALNEYAVAKQRAADAAAAEQEAKKVVEATADRHRALQCRRNDAEKLLEPARAELLAAKDQISELERQLQDAQKLAEQKSVALDECATRAKACTADEADAAAEAAEAAARHAECQSANATVAKETQAAKERAERLQKESGAQSVAAISDVRALALKIADGARGLNGSVELSV